MISTQRFSQVVDTIYSAAEEKARWNDVMSEVAAVVDVDVVLLISSDTLHPETDILAYSGVHGSAISSYLQDWAGLDVWMQSRHPVTSTPGAVYRSEELMSARDLLRTPFYNHWLRKLGLGRMLTSNVQISASQRAIVACNFGIDREPATQEQISVLEMLTPHLMRSIQLHRVLGDSRSFADEVRTLLDRIDIGVLLIDSLGRVAGKNDEATRILASHPGLSIADRKVRSPDATLDREIQQTLNSAKYGATLFDHNVELLLSGQEYARPLRITICPVARSVSQIRGEGLSAVVLVSDPTESLDNSADLIRRKYGLTRQETRVAILIARGGNLRAISKELGVSYETVRSHSKRIYQKLGISSQADIVRVFYESAMLL